MTTKIVFMGSPEFALPTLEVLAEKFNLIGVVTQPDQPSGRGKKVQAPPVKLVAQDLNLPIMQPKKLSDPEALDQLREWDPDAIVVAAFGQILKPDVLELPMFGCINVHASLLPRWRGAAPIQAAILNNDQCTGITIMSMDSGVDTGPILSQRSTPIHPTDSAGILSQRLAHIGAELLVETLPGYLVSEITPVDQDAGAATHAPMLKKKDGELDFSQPAKALALRVRAFNPWPGTYTILNNKMLKIHSAITSPEVVNPGRKINPGQRTLCQGKPAIVTNDGLLILEQVQPEGKRIMSGNEFLLGARDWLE